MTALAFITLATPTLIGALCGRIGLFDNPDAAVTTLNRYALYIAFPALVFAGLTDASFVPPDQPGFWLLIWVAMAATAALSRLAAPVHAGPLTLAGISGNVAYIGLPLCVSVLGDGALGTASLAVSVFILGALTLGPTLLVRWGGGPDASPIRGVLRQPLFWAPFVGLGARLLPASVLQPLHSLAKPLGSSAAPVALFLLGLYLWTQRARLGEGGRVAVGLVSAKLLLFPALVALLVWAARAAGWHDDQAARIFLIMAATPTAIAAFALANEFEIGQEPVAQGVVGSTLLSALTLPIATAMVLYWLPVIG